MKTVIIVDKKSEKIKAENIIEIDLSDLESYRNFRHGIEFVNFPSQMIEGKTILEWFAIENISYWWFAAPILHPKYNDAVLFINRFSSFLEKNSLLQIDDSKFVYFPLQVDPDRNLLLGSPYLTNQIESIRNIAKSLPVDHKLFVKEHPGQKREWRNISFYKEILDIPNVKFIHPSVSSEELYKKCSLVITSGGSSGFEASFFQKPTIVFSDTIYNRLDCVSRISNIEDLPFIINESLNKEISSNDLDKFLVFLEKNSFDFDLFGYIFIELKEFFHDSILLDVEIKQNKMEKFLEKHFKLIDIIGNQLIKEINVRKK